MTRDETTARAIAHWIDSLLGSEDVRLAPGAQAVEWVADALRCEASGGLANIKPYGMADAVVGFEGVSGAGQYESVPRGAERVPGDEVLVDGVWLRWVSGDETRHPAWDVLGRRSWRRKRASALDMPAIMTHDDDNG